MPLLAQLREQARDLLRGEAPQQLGRGHALGGIEAHVERLLALEREAAPRLVQLVRREPEVEQHRGRALHARAARERGEVAEAAVREDHARAEAREAARGARERLRIAIDAEEARVVRALEEPLRVPAEADGPVDHPAAVPGTEHEGDLVGEDGDVLAAHTPLLARRARRSSSGPACSRWYVVQRPSSHTSK